MKTENQLSEMLSKIANLSNIEEIVAIVAAVQWIAEHDCPDGFGTYWHEKCQKLVKNDAAS